MFNSKFIIKNNNEELERYEISIQNKEHLNEVSYITKCIFVSDFTNLMVYWIKNTVISF